LIEPTLTKTAQRRRLQRGVKRLYEGVFWGAALGIVLLGAYKLLPIPGEEDAYAGMKVPLGAELGFAWGWSRPLTLEQTARWVDGERKLQERLSTALEIARSERENGHWKSLIVSDAARAASTLNPKDLLPFRIPRVTRWAVLLLVLGVG